MHIQTTKLPHRPTRFAPSAPKTEEQSPAEPQDTVATISSAWADIDTEPVAHPKSPPPALERPVLFLHGFNGSAGRWDHVFDWLTSGEEPVNKSGGIVDAGKFDDLDPEANLFSLRFSRAYNSVEVNTAEVKEAVEAVLQATGAEELDLVVHSLGGLDARAYLQDEDEKVNKLVMMGTPNHGSQLANMELFFREKFDFPLVPPTDDAEVRKLLHQMTPDKLDKNKEPKNPWLRALNNDWENQRDKADVLIVAGAGIPTLTSGPGLTIRGDGVVTRRSSTLKGVKRKTAWFRSHGRIQNSAKVMESTAKFLMGKQLSPGENLFDSPEDALRAAELLAGNPPSDAPPVGRASPETVDQAVKLPLLDPAFQLGLGLGVMSAIMGGPRESLPLIEIGMKSESHDNKIDANYNIDLARDSNHLQGSGLVNDEPFAEVAHFEDGKVQWTSAMGIEASGLTMEVSEEEDSILLRGEMGGVDTDLELALTRNEEGQMTGLETLGSFNGEQYAVRSKLDLEGLLKGGPLHHTDMHMTGLVNGEDVERTYRVDVHKTQDGLKFNAQSAATQVQDQAVGVTVTIKDRDEA